MSKFHYLPHLNLPNFVLLQFLMFSVMMISGGLSLSSVEVLSNTGSLLPCSLPPLPTSRYLHTQDGVVACGGATSGDTTSCVTLTAAGWEETHNLRQERVGHSSWRSPAGLLLMGGIHSPTTTELLSYTDSTTADSYQTLGWLEPK